MSKTRKKLRASRPNHRPKSQRIPAIEHTPGERETLDRWLTPDRLAIVTTTRFLDDNWPTHWQ